MKPKRFTAKHFIGYDMSPPGPSVSKYGLETYQAERIAKLANAQLIEWEKECERVFLTFIEMEGHQEFYGQSVPNGIETAKALLWNVENIEGEG